MKKALIIATLALSMLGTSPFVSSAAADPAAQNDQTPAMLQGQVDALAILSDQVQSDIGIECTKSGTNDVKVSKVKPGSEAGNKGVQENDVIQDARVEPNVIVLSINRDGRVFTLTLDRKETNPVPLQAMQPKLDVPVPKPFTLKASQFQSTVKKQDIPVLTVLQQKLKPLADYTVELIVDRSLSMRRRDCPGRESRWNWCGDQAEELARNISPLLPKGISITTFAHDHEVYEHSTAQKIVEVFENPHFQLGTFLYEAINDRLENYFAKRRPGSKPLLIAVVTDGLPTPMPQPAMVRDKLISATKRMKDSREITVVFLQIGGRDPSGERFLHDLDVNLVNNGARYDIVHTILFSQLMQSGLSQALVDAVQSNKELADSRTGSPSSDSPRPARGARRMRLNRFGNP